MLPDGDRRALDEAEVGQAIGQRSGDADDGHIEPFKITVVSSREVTAIKRFSKFTIADIPDMTSPRSEGATRSEAISKPMTRIADGRCPHGKGEADVALPDHRDRRHTSFDSPE
jgi:hypothetical protein